MNYRHAFHAGNFADCMKHALLVWLLRALARKPAPFAVLDTHAGIGRYDLSGPEAERTGEWRQGLARVMEHAPPELADYLAQVAAAGAPAFYPGSPLLIRGLLRPQDRLVACELHPDDAATLRETAGRDGQVAVHHRDGYEAIGALLPPAGGIRRGLVLIDPPFEQPAEFDRLAEAVLLARRRFNTGIIAAWYPIKHRAPVRAFHDRLVDSGLPDLVAAELLLRPPLDPQRLNGCGLLVAAPPFGFEAAASATLSALAWAVGGPGATESVRRLSAEKVGA